MKDYDEYPPLPYENVEPVRVRSKGTPRQPCIECHHEVVDDGLGDLVHAYSGRYQCAGRNTVAVLSRNQAVVPGTDRPKRNWGRESSRDRVRSRVNDRRRGE